MSLTARKLLGSQTVFNFLQSKFNETYNSLIDQGLVSNEELIFELYKDQADYDGKILVTSYADEDDAQKKNLGLFRFVGGEVDPSQLTNVYLQRFAFEMLAFEEYRDDIRNIVTTFCSSLNGNAFPLSDENGDFLLFVQVQEFPDLTQTIDADGADKFIASTVVDILFYQDVIHSISTSLKINGVDVPFSDIVFNRSVAEPSVDLRKGYEMKYLPNRSAFAATITGYYTKTEASSKVVDWIMDEENLEESVRLYYNDGFKLKTGVFMISENRLTIPFESVISYQLTLIPLRGAEQTYFGVMAKGADSGDGEYLVGSTVTVVSEDENFDEWVIESGGPLIFLDGTSASSSTVKFQMPANNVILREVIATE